MHPLANNVTPLDDAHCHEPGIGPASIMKRSEQLEPLSHDHYEGLQVARRLRTGLATSAPPEEMAAYMVHFWDTYLTEHFRQEETLLVPALEAADGAGLAEQMVSEHRALALQAVADRLAPSSLVRGRWCLRWRRSEMSRSVAVY